MRVRDSGLMFGLVLVLGNAVFGGFGTYNFTSGSGDFPSGDWTWTTNFTGDTTNNTQTSMKSDYNDSVMDFGPSVNLPWVLQTALKGGSTYSFFSNDLGTATEVSVGATFRVRGARGTAPGTLGGSYGYGQYHNAVNNLNDTNAGPALLTIMTQNGPAFDLNVWQDTSDHYSYQVNKFDVNSTHENMTKLSTLGPIDASNATAQKDPNWHTIWMYSNSATGNIKVNWDGVNVLDMNLGSVSTGLGAKAMFGSGTVYNSAGNSTARLNAFWQNVSVQEGLAPIFVPEPASLALLGLGGVALLRRRR